MKNKVNLNDIRVVPSIWQVVLGITVVDPDGWNRQAAWFPHDWGQALNITEFLAKLSVSTVDKLYREEDLIKKFEERYLNQRRSHDGLAFKNRVKSIINSHLIYRSTSSAVQWDIWNLKKDYNLSSYYWNWAEGYRDAAQDNWYRNNLVHCYNVDGKLYGKWNTFPEEIKEKFRRNEVTIGGFYWKDKDGNPDISKPYFVSEHNKKAMEVIGKVI